MFFFFFSFFYFHSLDWLPFNNNSTNKKIMLSFDRLLNGIGKINANRRRRRRQPFTCLCFCASHPKRKPVDWISHDCRCFGADNPSDAVNKLYHPSGVEVFYSMRHVEEAWHHLMKSEDTAKFKQIAVCNFDFLLASVSAAVACTRCTSIWREVRRQREWTANSVDTRYFAYTVRRSGERFLLR